MDKFQFAKLVNVLSHWGMRELELHEIIELDVLIDVQLEPKPKSIQDALGTDKNGEALVEVARNALQKLAALQRMVNDKSSDLELGAQVRQFMKEGA